MVIGYWLLVICYWLFGNLSLFLMTIANSQQSTVNTQPSTVNRQQSTDNSQPSTVNRQQTNNKCLH